MAIFLFLRLTEILLRAAFKYPRLRSVISDPSLIFFVFTACFVFWLIDLWRPYNLQKGEHNFVWDMFSYYSYLPAIFLNHGSFTFDPSIVNYAPISPLGEHFSKYTYGVALLQLPFFLLAWAWSLLQGEVGNGFGAYFTTFNEYGSIAYVLYGCWLLRRVLLSYYSRRAAAFGLVLAFYGTMLFMYGLVQVQMSHSYLFFLFSFFIYCTWRYYDSDRWAPLWGVAVSGALICLIRPVEIYIYLLFLFWNVRSLGEIRSRMVEFFCDLRRPLLLAIVALAVWIPQFVYWKVYTGRFLFDAYGDEHFFWKDPQIFNVLFSYRKGWLVYTPAVLLCFVGIFFAGKKGPLSGWVYFFMLLISVYVCSCWWTWDYGGCFGAREFSQHIAFLIFPVTALFQRVLIDRGVFVLQRAVSFCVIIFVLSSICLNIGQTYQYQVQRKIHPSQMSRDLYWSLFRTFQHNKHFEEDVYWKQLNINRSEQWRKGLERDDRSAK